MVPQKNYFSFFGIGLVWDVILLMVLPLLVPCYVAVTVATISYYVILFFYFHYRDDNFGQFLAFLSIVVHIVYVIYLFSFMFAL